MITILFFFSSRRRHTRFDCDWSSDVCSSDLRTGIPMVSNAVAMLAAWYPVTLFLALKSRHARFPQIQSRRHARLRERDSDARARHPPQLRAVSAADEHGQRLAARGVRFSRHVAEPSVGHLAAVCPT